MNYGKVLPYTGGALAASSLGYWLPVLIGTGLILTGALLVRLCKPIKR